MADAEFKCQVCDVTLQSFTVHEHFASLQHKETEDLLMTDFVNQCVKINNGLDASQPNSCFICPYAGKEEENFLFHLETETHKNRLRSLLSSDDDYSMETYVCLVCEFHVAYLEQFKCHISTCNHVMRVEYMLLALISLNSPASQVISKERQSSILSKYRHPDYVQSVNRSDSPYVHKKFNRGKYSECPKVHQADQDENITTPIITSIYTLNSETDKENLNLQNTPSSPRRQKDDRSNSMGTPRRRRKKKRTSWTVSKRKNQKQKEDKPWTVVKGRDSEIDEDDVFLEKPCLDVRPESASNMSPSNKRLKVSAAGSYFDGTDASFDITETVPTGQVAVSCKLCHEECATYYDVQSHFLSDKHIQMEDTLLERFINTCVKVNMGIDPGSPNTCYICPYSSNDQFEFKHHTDSEEHQSRLSRLLQKDEDGSTNMYTCKLCIYSTLEFYDFQQHLTSYLHTQTVDSTLRALTEARSTSTSSVSDMTDIKCNNCSEVFEHKLNLKLHKQYNHCYSPAVNSNNFDATSIDRVKGITRLQKMRSKLQNLKSKGTNFIQKHLSAKRANTKEITNCNIRKKLVNGASSVTKKPSVLPKSRQPLCTIPENENCESKVMCEICDVSVNVGKHVLSAAHKLMESRLVKKFINSYVKVSTGIHPSLPNTCYVCPMSFNNNAAFHQHLQTKNHSKRMERMLYLADNSPVMQPYACLLCS